MNFKNGMKLRLKSIESMRNTETYDTEHDCLVFADGTEYEWIFKHSFISQFNKIITAQHRESNIPLERQFIDSNARTYLSPKIIEEVISVPEERHTSIGDDEDQW